MTIIKTAAWGASVLFRATFFDEDGDPISPTTVTLRARQGRRSVEGAMTPDGGDFIYRLDTSAGFKPGPFHWAIDAEGDGDTKVAEDGQIVLTANPARAAAA